VGVVAFVQAGVGSKAAGGNDLSVCTVTASGEQIGCCGRVVCTVVLC